jgi:hypothetical protein
MTAKTTIAILDSDLTPESPGTPAAATRTFTPGEVEQGNVHTFYEPTTGVTAATRSRMTVALTSGKDVTRMKLTLALPKAQTVDGITQVAHVTRASVEFIFPANGSRDDRRDCRTLTRTALGHADIIAMIDNLENFW